MESEGEVTTFWRDGYWRSSVYGNLHWVEGHEVTRDVWDRSSFPASSGTSAEYYRRCLSEARAGMSVAATYVTPNAQCPVCGAAVFFYQNENGSRVFFDDLGPPWPKHPCTDTLLVGANKREDSNENVAPTARHRDDVSTVEAWLSRSGLDVLADFARRTDGLSPWPAYVLEGRFAIANATLLVLRKLGSAKATRTFLSVAALPKHVKAGALVFYYRGWISTFDPHVAANADIEVKRLSGSSQFIDAMIGLHSFELHPQFG